jgi:hypothetical protein
MIRRRRDIFGGDEISIHKNDGTDLTRYMSDRPNMSAQFEWDLMEDTRMEGRIAFGMAFWKATGRKMRVYYTVYTVLMFFSSEESMLDGQHSNKGARSALGRPFQLSVSPFI